MLLLIVCAGCAPGGGSVREQIASGDLEGAQKALERERRRQPDSVETRIALGEVYYRIARDALDRERDEGRYLAYLERAVSEFVRASALDPVNELPHFYLAVIDVYRGDLHGALRGFNNTRRLRGVGVDYTNIGETYVYLGHLHKARRWTQLGKQKGVDAGVIMFNEMLISWKEGDLESAKWRFESILAYYPQHLREINVARVPKMPTTFEQYAGYCCGSPGCGPYMRDACAALALEVRDRELSEEALLKELRIEIEKKRALREIYEQRKELNVTIDP